VCLGEIVMRFGLLWKTLQFNISFVGELLNAACLLHNFIVDERDCGGDDCNYAACNATATVVVPRDMEDVPLVTDNNEPRPLGRPSSTSIVSKNQGRLLRETISTNLHGAQLSRPLHKRCKHNQYGMVYMEY